MRKSGKLSTGAARARTALGAAALLTALLLPALLGAAAARAQPTETPAKSSATISAGEALPDAGAPWRPALAMHGAPALGPDFTHLPYADPAAPYGGRMRVAAVGAFDTLNPFVVGGRAPYAVSHYTIESLMTRSWDEPFTLYGLLAEAVATPEDRSFVAFRLNPKARFADGTPVTVEDVIFSLETLREKGKPNHRSYYNQISRIERLGPRSLKLYFKQPDRELPLLIGLLPVLSKADWEGRAFEEASFRAPLGSGPYRVASVDEGRGLVFERREDYWGRDLPVNAGRFRLDRIDYLYFRSQDAVWEAFKAGDLDLFVESRPSRWRDGYGFPAAAAGRILRREIPLRRPSGVEGFVFNTRKALFQDRRVREALALAFDYDWVNENYYAGQMTRITSYFGGSDLGFSGRAVGAEQRLLAKVAGERAPALIAGGWRPLAPGERRQALRRAARLLAEAGWRVRNYRLVNAEGRPFRFEIMVDKREHERIARSFVENLEWLGVEARVRLVDQSQRQQRLQTYDFDMIANRWMFSLSPGQEQRFYFGSAGRDAAGGRNYMGVADPAVDALIDAMLAARDETAFQAAVRAYDRVLSSGIYVIPWGWRSVDWVAHDARLRIPERTPAYGFVEEVVHRAADEVDAAAAQ